MLVECPGWIFGCMRIGGSLVCKSMCVSVDDSESESIIFSVGDNRKPATPRNEAQTVMLGWLDTCMGREGSYASLSEFHSRGARSNFVRFGPSVLFVPSCVFATLSWTLFAYGLVCLALDRFRELLRKTRHNHELAIPLSRAKFRWFADRENEEGLALRGSASRAHGQLYLIAVTVEICKPEYRRKANFERPNYKTVFTGRAGLNNKRSERKIFNANGHRCLIIFAE